MAPPFDGANRDLFHKLQTRTFNRGVVHTSLLYGTLAASTNTNSASMVIATTVQLSERVYRPDELSQGRQGSLSTYSLCSPGGLASLLLHSMYPLSSGPDELVGVYLPSYRQLIFRDRYQLVSSIF